MSSEGESGLRGGGVVLARKYRPRTSSPMKIPEEMKKKDVLKKSEPRIGCQAGQKGEVQPIANITAHIVIRIAPRTQRLRSDKFAGIFRLTVRWLLSTKGVSRFFALIVSLRCFHFFSI